MVENRLDQQPDNVEERVALDIKDGVSMTEGPTRNEIRSARTREKVLDATIECIYEFGLLKTSTIDITKRAGISRGAMLHHYPSKEELLSAAYEALLKKEAAKLRRAAEDYRNGGLTVEEFIDRLWERFSVESFSITMDYFAAARTDKNLRKNIKKARQDYDNALADIWMNYFSESHNDRCDLLAHMRLTVSLFRGMSMQRCVLEDQDAQDEMIDIWKRHVRSALR